MRRGAVIELREHQEDPLQSIEELRSRGITIALLPHATRTAKTVTAIADAKRLGGRTLFIVHTRDLVNQAAGKFKELWPDATCGLFLDAVHDTDEQVSVGTVQSVSKHLPRSKPDDFAYLVVDE